MKNKDMNMMQTMMFIIRGISGSGKSTLALMLGVLTGAEVYSTDDFFLDAKGNYVFDGRKLSEYHNLNMERVLNHLRHRPHVPLIIDNTNTTPWEMKPYIAAGLLANMKVQIVTVRATVEEAFERCTHNVPLEAIQDQERRLTHNLCGLGVNFTEVNNTSNGWEFP